MLSLLLIACGGPPTAPLENDPAYAIEHREWLLIGNALTEGHETLDLAVTPPQGAGPISVWLGDDKYALDDDNTLSIDVSDMPPGERYLIWQDGGTAFALTRVVRSHPLYVVVSVDWDSPDTSDAVMDWQYDLHERHPELVITHFVGPYTWTDPELPVERQQSLTADLHSYQDDHGDEIALHIHPYCHFVATTDVTCQTEDSFFGTPDPTGYAVPNYLYSEGEFTDLLHSADDIFVQQGFAKPTSYRAGGWSMDLHILQALANAGYVADTSANNWMRLEEWEGQGTLYEWNREQWSSIDETSQPYYPAGNDILSPGDPYIPVLEVPDNGILVDYVDTDEMIEMLAANYDGEALPEPTQYSIGWHDNANASYRQRIDGILEHFEDHLSANDNGPLVYENLSDLVLVWPQP